MFTFQPLSHMHVLYMQHSHLDIPARLLCPIAEQALQLTACLQLGTVSHSPAHKPLGGP